MHKMKRRAKPSTVSKATVLVCAMMLFIIILEGVSRIIIALNDTPDIVAIGEPYKIDRDDDLGYRLAANATWQAGKKLSNGTIIYNVTYRTDTYGRRTSDTKDAAAGNVYDEYYDSRAPSLLVFGDSVTFGEGLPSEGTLPHYLQEALPEYNVYNYGVSGYGPNNALAKIQQGTACQEASIASGDNRSIALFVLIPAHVNRVIGNTLDWWGYDGPYYYLRKEGTDNEETLIRSGSFRTGRPLTTKIYEGFVWLRDRSAFLELSGLQLPPFGRSSDIELTAAVLAAAKDEYESRCGGTFIVILHPEWYRHVDARINAQIKRSLDSRDVRYLDYSKYHYTDDKVIPYDQHPTAELNKDLAALLAKDIPAILG